VTDLARSPSSTVTASSDISVLLFDLDAVAPVDDLSALPADDLAVASHIADGQRRRRFLAARREVRLTLAQIVGMPPAAVPIHRGRNGKPLVADMPVHFSVATRGAACAIATALHHPVGVEVARVPHQTPAPVLGQLLPPSARSAVLAAAPDEQPREFALWWCRVEAAVRACGAGLDEAAACLDVAPQEARVFGPDLVAAVAIAHRAADLDVWWRVAALAGAVR
jgi:phosphopantetheinyl transferase